MNIILIFAVVWGAFIAMSFWESSVEGRKAGNRGKSGFRIRLFGRNYITKYHFFLFYIFMPLLVFALPLAVYGFNWKLFGILISAFYSGVAIEDFFWFVVNPKIIFKKDFNPKFVNYYPWIKIGKTNIPTYYIIDLGIAVLSWLIIWR